MGYLPTKNDIKNRLMGNITNKDKIVIFGNKCRIFVNITPT